jgi:hypothetical protein
MIEGEDSFGGGISKAEAFSLIVMSFFFLASFPCKLQLI